MAITSRQSVVEARPVDGVGIPIQVWTVNRRGVWVSQCPQLPDVVTESVDVQTSVDLCVYDVCRIVNLRKIRKQSLGLVKVDRQPPTGALVRKVRLVP